MKEEFSKIEVRSIKNSDWYWISRKIFDDYAFKIGAIGLALYNAYASYARGKGKAFPSQKKLAEKLGVSVKTVIKYNKILQANNLIKIERRRGRTNLVTLLKIGNVKECKIPAESSSVKGVKKVHSKENNIKENTNVDDKKSSAIDVFEYFKSKVREFKGFSPEVNWSKDGKLAKKRLKKYSIEEIKELIDWYLNSKYFDKFGASLSICLSTFMINLWKAEKLGQRSIESLYPTWKRKQ